MDENLKARLEGIEGRLERMENFLYAKLNTNGQTKTMLIKWVIFPLIFVVGGLVGIRIL